MMRNMVLLALVAVLALAPSALASRDLKQMDMDMDMTYPAKFRAMLSGMNEVPEVESMAFGKSHLVLENATSGRIFWQFMDIKFVVAAHVHMGNSTSNGPVLVTAAGFSGNGISGDFQSTITFDPSSVPNLYEELMAGDVYFNAHTTTYPGGEIRGTYMMCADMMC
jgi:hypothetical protein